MHFAAEFAVDDLDNSCGQLFVKRLEAFTGPSELCDVTLEVFTHQEPFGCQIVAAAGRRVDNRSDSALPGPKL